MEVYCKGQRWSRGHKARDQDQGHKKIRGQGQEQPYRGQTLSRPRTVMLEAKAKDQGHKRKCSPKKRSSEKFFKRSPEKIVFQKFFQALHKLLTTQRIVLSSSRGQGNFRGLEASRPRSKDFKMCPRGQRRPRGLHLWQRDSVKPPPCVVHRWAAWIEDWMVPSLSLGA